MSDKKPETHKRIFVQYLDDNGEPNAGDEWHEGITWCQDQIHKTDTEYVRLDLYAARERELAEAREEIIDLSDIIDEYDDLMTQHYNDYIKQKERAEKAEQRTRNANERADLIRNEKDAEIARLREKNERLKEAVRHFASPLKLKEYDYDLAKLIDNNPPTEQT